MGNRAEPRWGLLHLTFTATAFNSGFSSHYYKDDKHFIYFFPARLPRWQHACTDPLPAPGDPCPTSILPFLPGVLGQAVRSLCKTQAGNQHQAGKTPRSRETRDLHRAVSSSLSTCNVILKLGKQKQIGTLEAAFSRVTPLLTGLRLAGGT